MFTYIYIYIYIYSEYPPCCRGLGVSFSGRKILSVHRDIIRTNICDEYSGSTKVTTRQTHIIVKQHLVQLFEQMDLLSICLEYSPGWDRVGSCHFNASVQVL